MVLGVPGRACARRSSPSPPVAHPVDHRLPGAAGAAARRRGRRAPAAAATTSPRSTRSRPPPGPTRTRGAPAGLRRVHPGQARAVGLGVPVEPARQTPLAPSPYLAGGARRDGRLGGRARRLAAKPEDGTPNPLRRTALRRRRGRPGAHRGARAPPGRRRARARGDGTPDDDRRGARPRGGRHGRPTGTPSSSGCSPRLAPTVGAWSRCRCRAACRQRRWPGCATTPSSSPASWRGRCRASRHRLRGSAPGSTPGSRRASASSRSSTPTTCPAGATSASTTRTSCGS